MPNAERPKAKGGLQYHLHTRERDLAPLCLLVGASGRAELVSKHLENAKRFQNPNRAEMLSFTGTFQKQPVSVVTTGMGAASLGIVVNEALRSGARIFVRVGSCGSLIRESKPGDVIIPSGAIRRDGVSETWAPIEYPALPDYRVFDALVRAAGELTPPGTFYTGIECTTADFSAQQGRHDAFGFISPSAQAKHEETIHLGVACYSMETAALFVFGSANAKVPTGAIHAIYANRMTNNFQPVGDELAVKIALRALVSLASDPTLDDYLTRRLPKNIKQT